MMTFIIFYSGIPAVYGGEDVNGRVPTPPVTFTAGVGRLGRADGFRQRGLGFLISRCYVRMPDATGLPSLSALRLCTAAQLLDYESGVDAAIAAVLTLGQSNNFLGKSHSRANLNDLQSFKQRILYAKAYQAQVAAGMNEPQETRATFTFPSMRPSY
jgi:hypothetical protein